MQPPGIERQRARVLTCRFVKSASGCKTIRVAFHARRLEDRKVLAREIMIRHEPQRLFVPTDGFVFAAGLGESAGQVVRRDVVARVDVGSPCPQRDRIVPVLRLVPREHGKRREQCGCCHRHCDSAAVRRQQLRDRDSDGKPDDDAGDVQIAVCGGLQPAGRQSGDGREHDGVRDPADPEQWPSAAERPRRHGDRRQTRDPERERQHVERRRNRQRIER